MLVCVCVRERCMRETELEKGQIHKIACVVAWMRVGHRLYVIPRGLISLKIMFLHEIVTFCAFVGAPYWPKWKLFWLFIEYTPLDM